MHGGGGLEASSPSSQTGLARYRCICRSPSVCPPLHASSLQRVDYSYFQATRPSSLLDKVLPTLMIPGEPGARTGHSERFAPRAFDADGAHRTA